MNKEELQKKIKELGPWYQRFEMDGIWTTNRKSSGSGLWNQIKSALPEDLSNQRILDLGCNAGYHTCCLAIEAAKVVGINIDNRNRQQAEFVREYFENKYGLLDIDFIWKDILEVDFDELGYFDYVIASAILYHVGKQYGKYTPKCLEAQKDLIRRVHSNKWIVRARRGQYKNAAHYNKVFGGQGFKSKIITVGKTRSLILYERQDI